MLQYPGIASHAHPPEAAYRLCQPSCSRNVLRNRLVGCAGEATQKVSPVCWPSGSKSAPRGRPTYRLRRPGGSKCGRCGAAFRLRSPGRSKGPPESRWVARASRLEKCPARAAYRLRRPSGPANICRSVPWCQSVISRLLGGHRRENMPAVVGS